MYPTTSGRFRVQDRRTDRNGPDGPSFVFVEIPDQSSTPTGGDASEAYEPLSVEGVHTDDVDIDALEPGTVVDATIVWDDGAARLATADVVTESRLYVVDEVHGLFEAATEAWNDAQAAGDSMAATTTRAQDGTPNGGLYVFADPPGRDLLAELGDGRVPIEPLIARVNDRLDDDRPREIFVLRPAAYEFVAVLIAFDRDGVLARTVRDTYDLGSSLVDRLEQVDSTTGVYTDSSGDRGDVDELQGPF